MATRLTFDSIAPCLGEILAFLELSDVQKMSCASSMLRTLVATTIRSAFLIGENYRNVPKLLTMSSTKINDLRLEYVAPSLVDDVSKLDFGYLSSLAVCHTTISKEALTSFQRCGRMNTLELVNIGFPGQCFHLFSTLRNLRDIKVSNVHPLVESDLASVVSASPNLSTFVISHQLNVKYLPILSGTLKYLYVSNCPRVEFISFCEDSKAGQLSLVSCEFQTVGISSQNLNAIVRSSPSLQSCLVTDCKALIGSLNFYNRSLRQIKLEHCSGLKLLLLECESMTSISLKGSINLQGIILLPKMLGNLDLFNLNKLDLLLINPYPVSINLVNCPNIDRRNEQNVANIRRLIEAHLQQQPDSKVRVLTEKLFGGA